MMVLNKLVRGNVSGKFGGAAGRTSNIRILEYSSIRIFEYSNIRILGMDPKKGGGIPCAISRVPGGLYFTILTPNRGMPAGHGCTLITEGAELLGMTRKWKVNR